MSVLETAQESAPKVGPGALVIVVGPSGAGKDTLIYGYKHQCADDETVMFVRRLITRPTDAGSEPHEAVCHDEMSDLIAQGRVALSWPAHGLVYALPECVDEHIAKGGIAIANGSRKALAEAVAKYEKVLVVHITAPISVLAERLASRGRETAADIEQRLHRADLSLPEVPHLVEIQNISTPEDGIALLSREIRKFAS